MNLKVYSFSLLAKQYLRFQNTELRVKNCTTILEETVQDWY